MNRDEQLDRLIDAGLKEYAAAEPRPGLEHRVLANLRSAPEEARRGWLRWAAVAAACAMLFALAWQLRRPATTPETAMKPPAPAVRPQTAAAPALRSATSSPGQPRHAITPAPPARAIVARRPSPLSGPLTPQERALVAFVQAAPLSAAQVAAEQSRDVARLQVQPLAVDPVEVAPLEK